RVSLEYLSRVEDTHHLDQPGHQSCPAGLVTGPEASAVVSVEVFVETNVVLPMRVVLELLGATVHWPPSRGVASENFDEPLRQFLSDLEQRQQLAGTDRALHPEVISIVEIELQERPYDEDVHRHPDGPSPVRVATKHA